MLVVMSLMVGWSLSKSFMSCCLIKFFIGVSIVWIEMSYEFVNLFLVLVIRMVLIWVGSLRVL